MSNKEISGKIPREIKQIAQALQDNSYEAYLVGGCVRDLTMDKTPKDWDITTSARPEEIEELFEHTYHNNEFGTVGVVNEEVEEESMQVVEVTPYRKESGYSDARRPDYVEFSFSIHDDLKRRDFTINAMALGLSGELIDPYRGKDDLAAGAIRAVGTPEERFSEDALRIMRAVRFAAELDFSIEPKTEKAINENSHQLKKIAKERIRDEFVRLIMSPNPRLGLEVARKIGVLRQIIHQLEEGIEIYQNKAHAYDVWQHHLRAVQHAADKSWSLEVRLASLLHDIGKPTSRKFSKEKNDWTFHGHEVISAKITKKILNELKFSKETIQDVYKLVRWHMFFSDPDKITLSAVRRMIRNVGEENIWRLMRVRMCDRIGTGRPKEQPFRFRKYEAMIEEALRDPISVKMLKIDGNRIMEITEEKPGPRLGYILHALLEEVLEDPQKNEAEYLENKAKELSNFSNEELKQKGEEGKEKTKEAEEGEKKEIKGKYNVR